MKVTALACVSVFVLWSAVAVASDSAVPSPRLLANGDVQIENLGSSFASRLTVVSLNTNADCRVVCQAFYCDENPSTDDGEVLLKDRYINEALKMFLGNVCESLSAEELVEDYRSGLMYLYLEDFRSYVNEDLADVGIDVVAVSMQAVGEFRRCVADQ